MIQYHVYIGYHKLLLRWLWGVLSCLLLQEMALGHVIKTANNTSQLEPLLLSVSVNQQSVPKIAECYLNANRHLFISSSDLHLWGLQPPLHAPLYYKHQRYYDLFWYNGLHYRLDEHALRLAVDVPPSWLPTTVLDGQPTRLTTRPLRPQHSGLVINYDLSLTHDTDTKKIDARGLLNFTLFNRLGLGVNDVLLASRKNSTESHIVRLETHWTLDQPERMVRWRLGDSITSAGNWSGAVRFLGIHYATDFSMQPNLVTFPLPSFKGEAVLPSTVNVFVNDALRQSNTITSGPFFLNSIPVVTGSGTLRVITKDILGREHVAILPYYSAPELLKPGLSNYSFEAGFVRKNFGIKSFDYGRLVGVGTYSRGITSNFTLESHAEASAQRQALGVTNHYLIPSLGVFLWSVAGSHHQYNPLRPHPHGHWGGLVKLGFHRQGKRVSLGARTTLTTPDFTHIGLQSDEPSPQVITQIFVGLGSNRLGTLSLSYTDIEHRVPFVGSSAVHTPPAELLTASYHTHLFSHAALILSSLFDLRDRHNNRFSATLIFSLDNHRTGSISTLYDNHHVHASATLNKAVPIGDGWGYRVLSSLHSDTTRLEAGATWHAPLGIYSADYAWFDGESSLRLEGSGSFIYFQKHGLFTRPCHNSFALVEVPGFKNVQVYQHNQIMGHTNTKGYLLLPNLLPYQKNNIYINPKDLPLGADLRSTQNTVIPYRGAGTLVTFDVKNMKHMLLNLVLADGSFVPAGATIQLTHTHSQDTFPVGYGGEAYLGVANLQTHTVTGIARWEDTQCRFSVKLPLTSHTIYELGKVPCQ